MTQIQPIQLPPQYQPPQPSYNAVKIDIHNPQVNAPGSASSSCQAPCQTQDCTAPIYAYPQAPIYEVPKQSIYNPQPPVMEQPKVAAPIVPPPVVVQPAAIQAPVIPAPVIQPPTVAQTPVATNPITPVAQAVAPAQVVDVKTPEVITAKVDLNEFITKLTSPDYEEQANAMEAIANMAQISPQKATELLDVKIIDTLLGIMNKDSNGLAGPTPQQLEIRGKIMSGKPVTEAEQVEANKITPMEQAERNKQYSIYTVAILQKLYGSEIEKMNNVVVPLTELPGAAGVVEQIKKNSNPMVRAASIDALSFIQRPEYKQDLTTLFTVAQKDQDGYVRETATKALDKLTKLTESKAEALPASAPAQVAEAKPAEKKAA